MKTEHRGIDRRNHWLALVTVVAVATFVSFRPAIAQDPLLWGSLKAGPHAVGFRSLFQLDYSRQYDQDYSSDPTKPPAPSPRPILIGLWYPAETTKSAPIEYRQYLDLTSTDPVADRFAKRLMPFVRETVCEETIGKTLKALNAAESAAFERLLKTHVFSIKDAPPATGRYPVVIYHPGLGGTYEDNSVLFELLASNGYVVISSAYQKADASIMNIDWDLARSFRDMEFLVRYAHELPFADVERLAAMGHSYGAQAVLAWSGVPHSALRSVVSIDSTVENVPADYPGFARLRSHFQDNKLNFHAPALRFASKDNRPKFETLDPYLKFAPRYEATVGSLEHNDYLAHGAIRPALLVGQSPDVAKGRALRLSYDRVCEHILNFLDATLKQRPEAQAFLQRSLRGEGLDDQFQLKFRSPRPAPPTARQLTQLLWKSGPEKAADLLRSCRDDVNIADTLGGARLVLIDFDDTVKANDQQLKEALTLFKLAADIFPKSHLVQSYLGKTCEVSGDRQGAIAAYRKGMELVSAEVTDEKERAMQIKAFERSLKKLGWEKEHSGDK
jgi:acetyl esterase/lipase